MLTPGDWQDDEARLLYEDATGMHYGSFGEQQVNGQDDLLEVQREIEALQRVVAQTSEYDASQDMSPNH